MNHTINVLVVDDEQIILDSIKKHLRKENYDVHCALSVQDAFNILDEVQIDLVLTDLMMPNIDGLEFMKIIKKNYPGIIVIIITGYATINTALQATQLGAFDYIAKPFSKTELKGVMKRAAELIAKKVIPAGKQVETEVAGQDSNQNNVRSFKTIGDKSWIMLEDDGIVLMGVERSFLHGVGRIQTVFLPSKGDELRQGSLYLQIFSTDLRSHTIISPLSGTVVEVNESVLKDPENTLKDPYAKGWLIRLKPSNFEYEIKMLGL